MRAAIHAGTIYLKLRQNRPAGHLEDGPVRRVREALAITRGLPQVLRTRLAQAQLVIETRRSEYNKMRPNTGLGGAGASRLRFAVDGISKGGDSSRPKCQSDLLLKTGGRQYL